MVLVTVSELTFTTLYFGEMVCRIPDPFGSLWRINQRIEEIDLTKPEEIQHRAAAFKNNKKKSRISCNIIQVFTIRK